MKKYLIFSFLCFIIFGCYPEKPAIDLSGQWQFQIDSLDMGIKNNWFNNRFEETIKLPGSMAENGKGDQVGDKTIWTGNIQDKNQLFSGIDSVEKSIITDAEAIN